MYKFSVLVKLENFYFDNTSTTRGGVKAVFFASKLVVLNGKLN